MCDEATNTPLLIRASMLQRLIRSRWKLTPTRVLGTLRRAVGLLSTMHYLAALRRQEVLWSKQCLISGSTMHQYTSQYGHRSIPNIATGVGKWTSQHIGSAAILTMFWHAANLAFTNRTHNWHQLCRICRQGRLPDQELWDIFSKISTHARLIFVFIESCVDWQCIDNVISTHT